MSTAEVRPPSRTSENQGFEHARDLAFERALESTIEQRLSWLEAMLEVARESGALASEVARRHRESKQNLLAPGPS